MSTSPAPGKPKVLLMHHFLDPGPALLAEVAEVITYPSNRPLDEQNIRGAAEGCIGIVSQLKDPIGPIVLSTPGLRCVSNVAVGYDNIDIAAATANHVWVTNTPGVLDDGDRSGRRAGRHFRAPGELQRLGDRHDARP